ncbi:ADP-ribosyl cyclase/cyclic ADP-ribose hydrolase [Citrus sinensis]|uniref:ADP-ribosyl cyclase/cyclic ADP-ribose hydrolase n=1 Tax=Citrus sinensis TaxID=2711 RepID=A0ACB8KA46_CITSI|nr:ADP-ribosyl cyclase/cyclic ADP-ribose hydrolase [Citrus sinensis]
MNLLRLFTARTRVVHKWVFSIFFEVEPTVVRKQTRSFHEAFAKHEEAFRESTEKVQNWRHALTEVANPSGWHLKDRHEVEFIQEIVKEISRKKGPRTLGILDDLVEMNSRLKKLRLLLDAESRDVRMIGICGMGGVELSEKDGLIALQKQLLSKTLMEIDIEIRNDFDGIKMIKRELRRRNVLVVIDDAVHIRQLNRLAGKHSWFGSGSRIIIPTRDEHLLRTLRVDGVYKVEKLDDDEALELFNKRAFDGQPSKDYVELIKRIVKYADGLPFALETLGSVLFGRSVDGWRSTLERLNKHSADEILDVLEISFNGLKGRIEIMRKSPEEPGKCSRLWKVADVSHVLRRNTPLNKLKLMRLSHSKNLIKTPDFTGAPNLEELILDGCKRLREIHSSLLVHGKLVLLKSRKLYKSYNSSKGDCY